MKCLDDCHTYDLDVIPGDFGSKPSHLDFYRLRPDGGKEPGTTNEEVLRVLIHRLMFLNEEWQGGKFKCKENTEALICLNHALFMLEMRTKKRTERGVEGTQEP